MLDKIMTVVNQEIHLTQMITVSVVHNEGIFLLRTRPQNFGFLFYFLFIFLFHMRPMM